MVHPRHRKNTVVAESLRAFSITNSVPIVWMTEDSAAVAKGLEAAERARKAQEEVRKAREVEREVRRKLRGDTIRKQKAEETRLVRIALLHAEN